MINLHERLSEFSYGYGVTREAEERLAARGLRATPLLPSLLHKAELGFDVAFAGPGQVVMLQFKLGQELTRFRRLHPGESIPALEKPFWRYHVNIAEQQFLRLEAYEHLGADVFYVAPRFSHWSAYDAAFHARQVLQRSFLLRPSAIRLGAGSGPTQHRINLTAVGNAAQLLGVFRRLAIARTDYHPIKFELKLELADDRIYRLVCRNHVLRRETLDLLSTEKSSSEGADLNAVAVL